jgi:HK97 family phage major capsid protein
MATKREQLEKLVHDMKAFADECDAKTEALSPDDRTKLDQMSADVTSLVASIKAEANANGSVDVAQAFLNDLAGVSGESAEPKVGQNGLIQPRAGMTLGAAFAQSPAFTEFVDQFKGSDGAIRNVRGLKSAEYNIGGFFNTVVTGASDTSGGAFVTPARYGPVSDLIGERELSVRDLCTNINISSDTFEFVQVTGKTNNAAGVAEATTSDDAAISGATPGPYTVATASGAKPESALTLAVVSTPVETIAHLMPITRRAAADAPQVRALVDQFLLYGLREEEEDQILNGNGTSPNLRGILQTSGISTVGSAGTDLDAIVDAIRTIRADRRRPNAMVIHPNDWYSTGFLLAKDTTNRYMIADPGAPADQQQALWGLKVVVTEAMTENTVLVGDFRQAVVADRQQAAIYVTDSHKDWFGRNLLAVLAEERLALGVLDPDAFCTVTAV